MKKVRLIPAVTAEQVKELASWYDLCGADALYFDASGDKEAAIKVIREIYRNADVPLYVSAKIHRFEDVKKLIYAGAKCVVAEADKEDYDAVKEAAARFGSERVWMSFPAGEPEETLAAVLDAVEKTSLGGVAVTGDTTDPSLARTMDYLSVKLEIPMFCYAESSALEDISQAVCMTMPSGLVFPGDDKINVMDLKQDLLTRKIPVYTFESNILFDEFKTNADGMVPCITQDYRTGEVLMLAYMTKESYEMTIKTGRMTYFSRSRNELWTKGDTSGHYQYVKSLTIDCDKDTILAKVAQIGAACHTGNRTCFFTPLAKKEYNAHNPLEVFEQVYDTITDRKEHPKEGSYTNYLFDQGIDKILKKCGEEATEIVIAAKNPDAEELKYEICDYLYHMMVLMAQCDITWKEITDELAERH